MSLAPRPYDRLVAEGSLGKVAADALKVEARRRVQDGRFFGHIAYASLIARSSGTRPGTPPGSAGR